MEREWGHGPDVAYIGGCGNRERGGSGQVVVEQFQHGGLDILVSPVKIAEQQALAIIPIARQRQMRQESVDPFELVVEVFQHEPLSLGSDRRIVGRSDQRAEHGQVSTDEAGAGVGGQLAA